MAPEENSVTAQCLAHDPPVPVVVGNIDDDNSRVTCPECHADFGSWGEVKTQMLESARKELQDELVKPFEGLKGWKVTRE